MGTDSFEAGAMIFLPTSLCGICLALGANRFPKKHLPYNYLTHSLLSSLESLITPLATRYRNCS